MDRLTLMRSFVGVTKSGSFSQEIVPGAPHSMYWETPALFNDAIGRFLAQVYATQPA